MSPSWRGGLHRDALTEKYEYFSDIQLWPTQMELDPDSWLSNFTDAELPSALRLLDAFVFLSDRVCSGLMVGAFQEIGRRYLHGMPAVARAAAWKDLLGRALVVPVAGERPGRYDSGHIFIRKARQVLQVDTVRLKEIVDAIELFRKGLSMPLIFVDDIAASGEQFVQTWKRPWRMADNQFVSFAEVLPLNDPVIYAPLIATPEAKVRIAEACPIVQVIPGNVLSEKYNAFAEEGYVWPPAEQAAGIEFILAASRRAGIPDNDGTDGDDYRGFMKLGRCLAFAHGVPDCTLPIFHWEKNGWKPLIRKR